ncbi:MAG: glutamate 5-kinase [Actinomycetota bacterium]
MSDAQTASGRPRLVVKIGTSSLTDDDGRIDEASIARLVEEVDHLGRDGVEVVVVTSGAIAAGLPQLGIDRPTDAVALQAVATVGQIELMRVWSDRFRRSGRHAGQVLLAPLDFMVRQQYLHARETLDQLLAMGVVPVVNENDAIADDEIRFGDNDRLAALVAHLVRASTLVLLTDTPGLLTGDPRLDPGATLIEEIVHVDEAVQRRAGATGSVRGSGGMASKLAAAKIAAWTGVRTVIADAQRDGVLADAWADVPGVGTTVLPHDRRLSARKLWIAFAVSAGGQVHVDDGARRALLDSGRSLLAAGVREVRGDFAVDQAVELVGPDGEVFAKGLVRTSAAELQAIAGRRSSELPESAPDEVIHRDDLVILPD